MLYKNTFPGWGPAQLVCEVLFLIAEVLVHPCLWSLSCLLSLYMPITKEQAHPGRVLFNKTIWTVPFLVWHICMYPIAFVGGILRLLLLGIRRKYIYVHKPNTAQPVPIQRNYSIASINVCLFQEFPSRINNLDDPYRRAKQIGERIIIDQYFYKDFQQRNGPQSPESRYSLRSRNHIIQEGVPERRDVQASVEAHFPQLDFICFQEVWQRCYSRLLIAELQKVFPYVIHDAGHWSLGCNYFMFNSGLLFASRYEILDVDFKPFLNSCKFCVINSKGLLMVKVLLGKTGAHKRDVGYMFCTHLQAYQGDQKVTDKQLDDILRWTEEFRQETASKHDSVKLDCISGDFNFDNMSPCDHELSSHPLFDQYEDPCRERQGMDKPWTVGTEFRQNLLWDQEVSTPEGLCSVLKDPLQRQRYMVDADLQTSTLDSIVNASCKVDQHGNVIPSPRGGKRRVDYVIHRKNVSRASKYKFVSRLATLTDHIPVALTLET
ncbi:sphingomyelin phosphodiesterase 5-like isoform X2 [Haliotis rufescens]|nr:sphingomyelin phosphodiesterase 5-like isoform X2 [Haliotis rufescens]XP_048253368.1 sphingomyelin phosphodiesterase 5-like isoform X2 [Haliotis rufescens]XP_048253369.1 sphingomyelin phosphodiesterase 5-like isoform X2 [Haliotis rufescens]XP_048253370.1 sphingomyelin phosphodiesterase 5-like isoform X2 [Haliotis rufescens]